MPRFVQRSGLSLCPIVAVETVPTGSAGSTTPDTYYDLSIEDVALSSAYNEFRLILNTSIEDETTTVENLTPTISDTTNFPYVSRLSSGIGRVKYSYRGISATRSLDMRTLSGGGVEKRVNGFDAGTVGKYAWDIIKPLLDAAGDTELLNGGVAVGGASDFGNGTYNASCWAAGFDFTGVAHKNTVNGTASRAGTLITRRHVLFAAHYLPPVGTTLTFIAADNSKITRTISAVNSGNVDGKVNPNPVVGDLAVALLSSDLPESIAHYEIADDWLFTDTGSGIVQQWVGIKLDKNRNALLAGYASLEPINYALVGGAYEGTTLTAKIRNNITDYGADDFLPHYLAGYAAYSSPSITGDSGTPRFLPKSDGSLILCGLVTSASGSGTFPRKDIIDLLIDSADSRAGINTGYAVTVAASPI